MTHPPSAPSPSSEQVAWSATDLASNPHDAADKADRVRRMFSAIAPCYDLNNRLHSFGLDQRWRRRVVRLCEVHASDRVLDVACGTGDLTLAFAAAGLAAVTGLDFAPPMLDIAREKARRRAGGRVAVEFIQGDAMDLPLPDATIDIVSVAFGIRNVADPLRALKEFRRVLRPGGRVAVLEFSEPANPILRSLNRLYTRGIMPLTASLVARDRSGAYRYLPRSVATFPDRQAFCDLLAQAGFSSVRQHALTFGTCVIYLGRADAARPMPEAGGTDRRTHKAM